MGDGKGASSRIILGQLARRNWRIFDIGEILLSAVWEVLVRFVDSPQHIGLSLKFTLEGNN